MEQKKILIVDDNHLLHRVFKEFFENMGYEAQTAENGLEGLDKYRSFQPDIVLMDVQMPVMNGYESSREIKNINPDAKIIMVTGHTLDPLAAKSVSEGYVKTIVPKPCTLKSLFRVVVHALAA